MVLRQLLVVLIALTFFIGTSQAQEVDWLRSASKAAELSETTGKPILVYVRSKTCHYCDLMQRNVWQNPQAVNEISKNFIPLKLTREENADSIEVLQIKGYPSTLVFSPQRKFLHRIDGYVDSKQFLREMAGVRSASAPAMGMTRR